MTETKPGQDDQMGEQAASAAAANRWARRDPAAATAGGHETNAAADPAATAAAAADPRADPRADPGADLGADPSAHLGPDLGADPRADDVGADPRADDVAADGALAVELAETKERLLRALAETENLRRRSAREQQEAHKYALTSFARELLDVADNLTRALESIPTRAREEIDFVRTLAEGVALTERSLAACFERNRIAKVEPGLGDKFDHNRHQAMLEIATSAQAPGTIAQVMQPGYVIADRLLRPAMVGVAKAAPAAAEAPADGAPDAGAAQPGDGQPGARLDTTA